MPKMTLKKVLKPIASGLCLAGKCVLCCVCLPCLCVMFTARKKREKPPEHYNLQPPRPLPPRRRSLTPPPSPSVARPFPSPSTTNTVALPTIGARIRRTLHLPTPRVVLAATHNALPRSRGGPTLLSLPLELRLQICDYVVGDQTLDIARLKKSLRLRGSRTITVPLKSAHPRWDCFQHRPSGSDSAAPPDLEIAPSPLALLRTCRQLYRDTITLLYRHTTFELRYPEQLGHLVARTRPQRHSDIRRLRICIPFIPSISLDDGAINLGVPRWDTLWDALPRHLPSVRFIEILVTPQATWLNPDWKRGIVGVHNAIASLIATAGVGLRPSCANAVDAPYLALHPPPPCTHQKLKPEHHPAGLAVGQIRATLRIFRCADCVGNDVDCWLGNLESSVEDTLVERGRHPGANLRSENRVTLAEQEDTAGPCERNLTRLIERARTEAILAQDHLQWM